MNYWMILTKLKMPSWGRTWMFFAILWSDFVSHKGWGAGGHAIDWWGYYKFVRGEDPPEYCYMDDPAWTPKERERLLRKPEEGS